MTANQKQKGKRWSTLWFASWGGGVILSGQQLIAELTVSLQRQAGLMSCLIKLNIACHDRKNVLKWTQSIRVLDVFGQLVICCQSTQIEMCVFAMSIVFKCVIKGAEIAQINYSDLNMWILVWIWPSGVFFYVLCHKRKNDHNVRTDFMRHNVLYKWLAGWLGRVCRQCSQPYIIQIVLIGKLCAFFYAQTNTFDVWESCDKRRVYYHRNVSLSLLLILNPLYVRCVCFLLLLS